MFLDLDLTGIDYCGLNQCGINFCGFGPNAKINYAKCGCFR